MQAPDGELKYPPPVPRLSKVRIVRERREIDPGATDPVAPYYSAIVFGAINMDLKAQAEGAWPERDHSTVGVFFQSPGGKGANEAVALARLGVNASLIGRVGRDEQGDFMVRSVSASTLTPP